MFSQLQGVGKEMVIFCPELNKVNHLGYKRVAILIENTLLLVLLSMGCIIIGLPVVKTYLVQADGNVTTVVTIILTIHSFQE